MQTERRIDVGVIGVGSMGRQHARVYAGLPEANLVGVFDVDDERAARVAGEHGAAAMDLESLLASVDAASIAVPTVHHYDVAVQCLEADVAMLIEKPLVTNLEEGRRLRSRTNRADVPVQVGHVERFNPAVVTLRKIVEDLSIISIHTERLGPPPNRRIDDSAVLDLMIHDIDVVLSLLDESPTSVKSTGVNDNRHASALLEFDSGIMASLTASRLTQRKVRRLTVTARECLVELDYIAQSIAIHRNSIPKYAERDGNVRFQHESVVERPQVPNEEPLRNELEAFVQAVASNETPTVTIDDGLAALELTHQIEAQAMGDRSDLGVRVADD
ncbi:Gfo/Idh/MocA family protein [Natronosalvus rutilus]|uniref:Gfo/Idh/MocA family oxidoreductase n=1 Tax=Natronosalvus rutilus TaxID=2953753 RepID=A0A9E7SUJ9_9EURY|nr:Gfo/Idh/MocA family oxidoreductase [Natronosalvus rutilus]UTF52061.1 Gfo/Idh/MocA family oxidoreductase [Natronosalvus rutilus]